MLVGPTRHSLIFFFLPPPTHLAARRAPRHLAARRPVVASRRPSLADPRRPRDLRTQPPAAIALAFGRPAATFACRPPPPSPSTDSRLDDGKRDARPAYWGSPCSGPAAPGRRAAAVLPPRQAGPLRCRRARPHRAGSPRSSGPAAPGCRATAELLDEGFRVSFSFFSQSTQYRRALGDALMPATNAPFSGSGNHQ